MAKEPNLANLVILDKIAPLVDELTQLEAIYKLETYIAKKKAYLRSEGNGGKNISTEEL